MFEDFKKYLKEHKRNFNERKFDTDSMYRCVCIGKYAVQYKIDRDKLPNDYNALIWEKSQYEKRNSRN